MGQLPTPVKCQENGDFKHLKHLKHEKMGFEVETMSWNSLIATKMGM